MDRTFFVYGGTVEGRRHLLIMASYYDLGSLLVGDSEWTVLGPTEPGPQPHGTGGDIALWVSRDEGRTWSKRREITRNSEFNHAYVRRALNARDPFSVFWADGDPNRLSVSKLYFGDSTGVHYWQLPYDMPGESATPIAINPAPPPAHE